MNNKPEDIVWVRRHIKANSADVRSLPTGERLQGFTGIIPLMDTLLLSVCISIWKTCNRLHRDRWSQIYQFVDFAIYKSPCGKVRKETEKRCRSKHPFVFITENIMKESEHRFVYVTSRLNLYFKACIKRIYRITPGAGVPMGFLSD